MLRAASVLAAATLIGKLSQDKNLKGADRKTYIKDCEAGRSSG